MDLTGHLTGPFTQVCPPDPYFSNPGKEKRSCIICKSCLNSFAKNRPSVNFLVYLRQIILISFPAGTKLILLAIFDDDLRKEPFI